MVFSNVIINVTIPRRSFVFGQSRAKVSAGFTNLRGPIKGFRDTGYSRKKLPGYGIFEEKVIGIQDIEK